MVSDSTTTTAGYPQRLKRGLEVAAVLTIFALHAGLRVPGVNEPHYLGKAKHFWNSTWITGDLFLDSADTHQVFYVTVGWISLFSSLATFAWLGRVVMWTAQAWTWTRLTRAVVGRAAWAPLSAALFVAACQHCQMAGEWVIGGLEAKGFAYALVFLALEFVVRGSWNRAGITLGAASAFHVLVGGWTTVASALCWIGVDRRRAPLKKIVPGIAVGGLIASLGLVPALSLTWAAPADLIHQANVIYVFQRLRHHLVPQSFPPVLVMRFALLAAAWVAVEWTLPCEPSRRRLRRVVIGSLLIASMGTIIALVTAGRPELAASLLRFYWFRLSDALLPLGAAMTAVALVLRWRQQRPMVANIMTICLITVGGWHLADRTTAQLATPRPPADAADKVTDYEAWCDVCRWIRQNTPPGTVWLTPRLAQTFKWRAQRGEVVNWKDITQDPADIVEWWHRIRAVHGTVEGGLPRYRETLAEQGARRLGQLAAQYGADYCLTRGEPRLDLPLVYRNRTYAVYRIE